MASLQARSSLRSAHPLIFVNKLISFTAFVVLLAAGWVAVSYLRNEFSSRWRSGSGESSPAVVNVTSLPASDSRAAVRLVYCCAGDKLYYHSSTHLPAQCDRTAMSEQAALGRGLKRCTICLPQ